MKFIIEALLIFFAIYGLWIWSGGVERGELRAANADNKPFIKLDDPN